MDYLIEHPTAADILAAVHEVKPKKKRKAKPSVDFGVKELDGEVLDIPNYLKESPETIPDDFRDSINFANSLLEQMKKSRVN